jgi:hypothetical protein
LATLAVAMIGCSGEEVEEESVGTARAALTLSHELTIVPDREGLVNGVATDADGNVYVAGWWEDVPVPYPLTTITVGGGGPVPNTWAGYVLSFDDAGAFRWGVQYRGTDGLGKFADVAVDGDDVVAAGCVGCYIGGGNPSRALVAKLDRHTGAPIYTRMFSGPGLVEINAVDIAESGNVFIAGFHEESVKFDAFTLPDQGTWGAFVVKLGTDGIARWARSFVASTPATGSAAWFNDVRVTHNEYVLLTGSKDASDTLALSSTLTLPAGGTLVLMMLKPTGNTAWGKTETGWRGTSIDYNNKNDTIHVVGSGSAGTRYARYAMSGVLQCSTSAIVQPPLVVALSDGRPMVLTDGSWSGVDGSITRISSLCTPALETTLSNFQHQNYTSWWTYHGLAAGPSGRLVVGGEFRVPPSPWDFDERVQVYE